MLAPPHIAVLHGQWPRALVLALDPLVAPVAGASAGLGWSAAAVLELASARVVLARSLCVWLLAEGLACLWGAH